MHIYTNGSGGGGVGTGRGKDMERGRSLDVHKYLMQIFIVACYMLGTKKGVCIYCTLLEMLLHEG